MHDAEGPQSDAEGTFSGRRRKDRVAPKPAIGMASESSTLKRRWTAKRFDDPTSPEPETPRAYSLVKDV
jgi:hypothetical protein